MNWDWIPPAAIVSGLLVFIVRIWQQLDERSALRRLERLAALRSQLPESGDSRASVDEAIEHVAARVVTRERPVDRSSSFITLLMFGAFIGLVTMAVGASATSWSQEVRIALVIYGGMMGLIAACLSLIIMIVQLKSIREARKALLKISVPGMNISKTD